MAAEELARKADSAFVDEDFAEAHQLYTQAIAIDSANSSLFSSRAQAEIKLEFYTDAVADATKAIELDPTLTKAYLRKGIACFHLEEYHTALEAFKAGSALEPTNPVFKNWIAKCETSLSEEATATVKEAQPTVIPDLNGPASAANTPSPDKDLGMQTQEVVTPTASQPAKPKYRHEYYQSQTQVVVTVFAKGLSKENVEVEFGEQFLSVVIKVPGEDTYTLQKRLFSKIIPAQCKFSILSTKVEIQLVKAEVVSWTALEYVKDQVIVPTINTSSEMVRPKYPSSNPKAIKDWDKIEAEVKKEEKEEKLDGDAALNKLFQEIYRDADEDTRRAMLKSFTESNGTVLSTNWKEVGAKHVDGTPPTGMEMKKWEL